MPLVSKHELTNNSGVEIDEAYHRVIGFSVEPDAKIGYIKVGVWVNRQAYLDNKPRADTLDVFFGEELYDQLNPGGTATNLVEGYLKLQANYIGAVESE